MIVRNGVLEGGGIGPRSESDITDSPHIAEAFPWVADVSERGAGI